MNKQETQRKICSVVWPYHLRRTMKALHSDHPFWEIHCIDYFPIFPPSCWDNDEINTEYPWLFTRNKACKACKGLTQVSFVMVVSWWWQGCLDEVQDWLKVFNLQVATSKTAVLELFAHADYSVLGCLFPENYESLWVTLLPVHSPLEQTMSILKVGV